MCKMNEILRVNDLHMYIVTWKFFYTWRKTVSATGQVAFSKNDVFSQKKNNLTCASHP